MPHSPQHLHDGADAARSGMPTGQRPEPSGWDMPLEPGIKGKAKRLGATVGRIIEDTAAHTRKGLARKPKSKPEADPSGWY